MRKLYTLFMYLALPGILVYLAWRGMKDRGYTQRWAERFGLFAGKAAPGGIVVHAASFGEVNAAAPLISALLKHMPGLPITVTTFTPTGSRRVQALFGGRVFHVYAPLDLPGAVRRFFQRVRPRLLIVLETEIWPNLFAEAARLGMPTLLSNARLSEKSAKRYQRTAGLIAETLARVSWAGAQSHEDVERLVQCGASRNHVEHAGNLKFDVAIPATLAAEAGALAALWGQDRPVVTAGSSHAADEDVLLDCFLEVRRSAPNALLILVPRHPERFAEAERKARSAGLSVALRSEPAACTPETECFVIDTMGELLRFYACCDVAFVGGTFASVGGHNLLEPAALGKPVLFGPNTQNTEEIAARLIACGGGLKVTSRAELTRAVLHWLTDVPDRDRAGKAARGMVEDSGGAMQRNLEVVRGYLEHS